MDNKEHLEKELVDFLISIIPVTWEKIAFYSDNNAGSSTLFYGVREEETDIVVTSDTFRKRYADYNFDRISASRKLLQTVRMLYENKCIIANDKRTFEIVCVIAADGDYRFEYIPHNSDNSDFMSREEFLMTYLNSEYFCVTSKYPSTDGIIKVPAL